MHYHELKHHFRESKTFISIICAGFLNESKEVNIDQWCSFLINEIYERKGELKQKTEKGCSKEND